jgi:capsular exopolysaccharide synthesis family protein
MGKIHDALRRSEEMRRGAPTAVETAAETDTAIEVASAAPAKSAPRAPAPVRGWFARRKVRSPAPRTRDAAISTGESTLSEEYRTLRARIQSLRRTRELRSIVITSTRPGEGKTTTAANLALGFGLEREGLTCLVDADLRTPRVHQTFRTAGRFGLAEVLEGDAKLDEALVAVSDTRLMVLPVRALPTAPSELLASRAMLELVAELHTRFQTVIFDAPPVLGLPDTVTLVDLCDAALFVVAAGAAPRDEVESALERLDASKIVGVVLNRCDSSEVPFAAPYGFGKS